MASIDERVVAMSFENTKFEANVATTMASLGKLDAAIGNIGKVNGLANIEASANKVTLTGPMSALDKLRQKLGLTTAGTTFTDMEKASDKVTLTEPMTALEKLQSKFGSVNAGSTFTDMEKAADRVSFSGLYSAIDSISGKFSVMSGAAAVAMGNIYTQALNVGGKIAKAFTLDPAIAGFHDYETQINAVQTILANTGLTGKKGLDQVNSALQNLQKYANLTVFNFADMAKNIGTFTAAGVDLKTSTESIKGIANLAALSGSNSQQASTAMYQLSQAIAAGKVGLQDWNSVVNAGLGGSVFQRALAQTAEKMGTLKKGSVDLVGPMKRVQINGEGFRQAITAKPGEKSWLTSDVLTSTLKQFTGDLSDAQLKAEGFNASEIKAIQAQAKVAVNAATQIKTFSQLTQALKEEVGTAYSNVFKTLFGNIKQATTLFSGLHTFLENALTKPINDFNKVLQEWAKLGGRTELIKGLKSAFADLKGVLEPIKEAFREIFPPATAKDLLHATKSFKDLMDSLKPAPETMDHIKRTFAGVFAVLHIGWTIIKDVFIIFGKLFGAASGAGGGFLGLTAKIGDFLVKVNHVVSDGKAFNAFLSGLSAILKDPIKFIKNLGEAIGDLFSGKGVGSAASALSGSVGGLRKALGPLSGLLTGVQGAWEGFLKILGKIKTALSPLMDDIANVIGHFGSTVADGIKNADYGKVFSAIQTTLIAGIFLAIKKALGGGINVDFGGGVLKSLGKTFGALTENLEAMQKNIQAHTLLLIAAAIGVLAVAVALLATIDPAKLTKALTATAVGMAELVAVLSVLDKAVKGPAFLKMPFIAGSLILLAGSLILLGLAMKIFATMSWEELAKGLLGVGGCLAAVGVGTKAISGAKVTATAVSLIPLAIGLAILAGAMKIFATMSWEEIGKGLAGVAGGLVAIGLAMKLMPPTLPLLGAGLILVSAGLVVLSGAVLAFGHMSLATLAKGILAIGGALVVIGLAMNTFPPNMIVQAAALLLVAGAMNVLAGAIAILGHMKLETLGKGIGAMGLSLLVLAVGLTAMSGSLPGSAALILAATGFALLVPALAAIGSLPWSVILKGIGAMALALGVLAAVGLLAAGPLVVLGAGILALGLGLAAVGGAVFLFAKGISLLSDKSVAAMAALITAVGLFLASFPQMIIKFVKGIVDILGTIVQVAPKIIEGIITIAGDLLDAIIKLSPKIAEAIGALITAFVKVLNENGGPIIDAGAKLFLKLLTGIADNIGKVVDTVARIITTFVNELAKKAPRLIRAGANLIAAVLTGVANGVGKIITAGGNIIVHIITGIGNGLKNLITAGGKAIANFLLGIANAGKRIITAGTRAARIFLNALADGIVAAVDIAYNAVIRLLNGLARVIRRNSRPLYNAGWNLASAIIDGAIDGLGNLGHRFLQKIVDLGKQGVHLLTHPWEAFSPSRVAMRLGQNIMEGLIKGIDDNSPRVHQSLAASAASSIKTMKSAFAKLPDALGNVTDLNPVITPVLDLSHVEKNAQKLNDILPSSLITANVSTDQAAKISSDQQAAVTDTAPPVPAGTTVTLNQNNYSPDPLPAIEIYRQTKNQLSQVKSLVGA